MLLKQLSKISKIYVKDLIKTRMGMICYFVDGLNSGYSSADIALKLKKHLEPSGIQPPLNKTFLQIMEMNYPVLNQLKMIYDLC